MTQAKSERPIIHAQVSRQAKRKLEQMAKRSKRSQAKMLEALIEDAYDAVGASNKMRVMA